jgi:hypothetical protein
MADSFHWETLLTDAVPVDPDVLAVCVQGGVTLLEQGLDVRQMSELAFRVDLPLSVGAQMATRIMGTEPPLAA